jgi:hypothetical protein
MSFKSSTVGRNWLTRWSRRVGKPEGLSTLIFLENCYYHAQWSNQKSAVFLLNFRTVPSLTFVHKFPISLCPFLILPLFHKKNWKIWKNWKYYKIIPPFLPHFLSLLLIFYVENVVRFHYRCPREIWIWLVLRCLKILHGNWDIR